jgi:hypothetical protein
VSTDPGLDELLARERLRDLGVSHTGTDTDWWDELYAGGTPDTHAPTVPTVPPKARIAKARPGRGLIPDWRRGETADLDADTPADTPPDTPNGPDTGPDKTTDTPPTSTDTVPNEADTGKDTAADWADTTDPDDPVQRDPWRAANPARVSARILQEQFAGLERRMRWLISTGAGAGIGWFLGLEPVMRGWIADCGHDTSPTGGLILGLGLVALNSYAIHLTRGWWPALSWCCRIPFATALLALCLYAPGAHP